jgi:GT2 family glycosyltransferase
MEDIGLCWRLLLEGRTIAVVSGSTVWHLGGGTLPADSPWKLKLNYRNNLLLLENNLARSLALEAMEKGASPEKAACKGVRGAKRTLLLRRFLDIVSALVYLLGGKTAYFRSVLEAHKAFREKRKGIILEEILSYARSHEGYAAPLRAPRWIVPAALCKGDRIFDYIWKRYENRH